MRTDVPIVAATVAIKFVIPSIRASMAGDVSRSVCRRFCPVVEMAKAFDSINFDDMSLSLAHFSLRTSSLN